MRSAKPPPEEWPIERESRGRIGLAQFADEIGEVVVELAAIGDVAARSRGAMAADVDGDGGHAGLGERPGDLVHLDRTGGRAVGQDGEPVARAARRPIEPVAKPGSVAGLEAAEVGRVRFVDP